MKVKEASKYFSIGRYSLYKAIHSGELRAYKPNGRDFLLKVSEIEEWIKTKTASRKEAHHAKHNPIHLQYETSPRH